MNNIGTLTQVERANEGFNHVCGQAVGRQLSRGLSCGRLAAREMRTLQTQSSHSPFWLL